MTTTTTTESEARDKGSKSSKQGELIFLARTVAAGVAAAAGRGTTAK